MDENLSAMLYGKMDLRLEKRPIPVLSKGEVLVRISNCGICGTDIHMWSSGECGHEMTIIDPVIIGHECSGIVAMVSDDVKHLKIGDHVALELGLPCRACDFCKRGRYNLCKPFSLGGLTQYMVYAADFCHIIPENVSLEAGALMEPLAVGVHACRRANVTIGKRVLVCGAGTIGLCSLLAARAMGASEVYITDVSVFRLKLASELGAADTFLVETETRSEGCVDASSLSSSLTSSSSSSSDNNNDVGKVLADRIVERIGCRPDCTIECSGAPVSLQAAIYATKTGGVMVPVALDPSEVRLPLLNAAIREVDIRGSFSYCNDYPAAISMVASGRIDPTPVITTRYRLEELLEAFEVARQPKEGVVKVMISCN